MSDSENYDPLTPRRRPGNKAGRRDPTLPRGLVIRVLAYLVVGNLLAGFLFLLFTVVGEG